MFTTLFARNFVFSIGLHVCIDVVMGTCIVIACSHHIESVDLMDFGITIQTSSRAPFFVKILKTIRHTVCPQEPLRTEIRAHTYICILYYIERHCYYLRIRLLLYLFIGLIYLKKTILVHRSLLSAVLYTGCPKRTETPRYILNGRRYQYHDPTKHPTQFCMVYLGV